MINVQGIRRNMKNVVKNYSEAQVKVREATSNDPWGPSSTLMSEIADLTYNVVAFSEIMQMIWKRLNDHGKNWRHVYKALVLLEYLIKTGSEKVAQQCRENIFAIQTLKDFQYIEENKDQGLNVREKSKLLVGLLKDDEKLRNERARALKAKERFAQSLSYMGSGNGVSETMPKTSASYHESLASGGDFGFASGHHRGPPGSELESARPQTIGEEELQLQLALAMSKEEAEQEERVRKNDDLRLQMALNQSEKGPRPVQERKSAMDDLLSLNVGGPLGAAAPTDPWGVPLNGAGPSGAFGNGLMGAQPKPIPRDPWGAVAQGNASNDPWSLPPSHGDMASGASNAATNDPWQASPTTMTPNNSSDPWSPVDGDNRSNLTSPGMSPLAPMALGSATTPPPPVRKTPETFLGPNSNLVNLDALVSTKTTTGILPSMGNPFAAPPAALVGNPFQAAKPPPPTINQLRAQNQFAPGDSGYNPVATPAPILQPQPAGSLLSGPASTLSSSTFPSSTQPPVQNPFNM